MKSASEYAELAEGAVTAARAQVYATLAQVAATLEAARLMGPTPEDQARLDALLCPGCGCIANIDHADFGLVCEEFPGCADLMESPK